MQKPCLSCTRSPNPLECEQKNCQQWQRWFIESWDSLRVQPRLQREFPAQPEGTVIGGRHYALPHRVHSYLDNDPCSGCQCPRDLCNIPCRVKRTWTRVRELLQ